MRVPLPGRRRSLVRARSLRIARREIAVERVRRVERERLDPEPVPTIAWR
jgi:hypothetical protein